ncbi:ATP-dependent protease La [Pluteus cervinus]|uniref:ATP-dependent protease La n=1 Tax=Pluteus cervinus TaxID=181527 RepID=A0ACD3A7W5_9AGAR|nr:ATP-dependent protease La [Pluteus cervinus]
MHRFSQSFRNTATRPSLTWHNQPLCTHSVLRYQAAVALQPRQRASVVYGHGFSTSTRSLARPSSFLLSPRWVNPKQGQNHDASKDDAADEGDSPSGQEGVEDGQKPVENPQEDSSPSSTPEVSESHEPSHPAPASAAPTSSSDPSSASSAGGEDPSPPPSPPPHPTSPGSIAKQSVPENYPQVLALPIARRPLFPGFYKAVVIRNPAVVAAVKEMMKRGQPYLGAFLLKDENVDADVITDIDAVHPVGVFAQITSVFNATPASGVAGEEVEEGLTAVLYPHRRIRITDLIKAGPVVVPEASETQSVTPPTPPSTPSPDGQLVPPGPIQTSFLHKHDISIVNIENLTTLPYNKDDQYIRAFMSEIVSVFKDIAQLNPLFRDQITNFSINQVAANVFDEPDKLADFAAAVSTGEVQELQDVLEALAVDDRLRKALLVLKKELINAQLQSKLARDVDSKIAKRQREYYLMEQLKGIKKELGMESDGKDKLIEKFKERAAALNMPEGVRKVFDEEISKLAGLEPAASEANVTRNYLDWLTQIPWGKHTPENYSIVHAQKVLDEDHYGLKDVKDRILEFLAVGKLRGTVEGKIICLAGPPGVGKTSIGKSIARALGRQFFRFSVGGLTDVAEIKGHRRTYVGALPGKIIQALKRVGTENPLVLIDEVDKIGRGINGDPASALLEMLDPEQNNSFLDHYMDVPVDLSRVLFVCTANNLDTIPAPLLDRMEVLEVSGYVSEEKAVIAQKYLGPQAKDASGLKDADVELDREAVDVLIKYYCRESGVRNLKKHIDKIYRKAALKLVQDLGEDTFPEPTVTTTALESESNDSSSPSTSSITTTGESTSTSTTSPESTSTTTTSSVESQEPLPNESEVNPDPQPTSEEKLTTTQQRKPMPIPSEVKVRITPETLKDYVGPPVYQKDRMYATPPPPGVSTGLGYLGNGSGAVMPVEAMSMPGKGGLQLTGKLGEVIRESAQIGLSWVKSHAYELGITSSASEQFLTERDIHVHMPEGSIGKEGPSAGTAILSAFVSLFKGVRINPDIAMTGEISLVGQVLPVGGLKEKILAAHRAGIKTIIAPAANRADIEENVPESVKTGIRFVYVENVKEVLLEVFKDETETVSRWKETLSS